MCAPKCIALGDGWVHVMSMRRMWHVQEKTHYTLQPNDTYGKCAIAKALKKRLYCICGNNKNKYKKLHKSINKFRVFEHCAWEQRVLLILLLFVRLPASRFGRLEQMWQRSNIPRQLPGNVVTASTHQLWPHAFAFTCTNRTKSEQICVNRWCQMAGDAIS